MSRTRRFWIVCMHGPYKETHVVEVSSKTAFVSFIATIKTEGGIYVESAFVPYHAITGIFYSDPNKKTEDEQ